eukprot:TRINITY_DN410_c0_g2_i1.p1 TRINITY_DN410_c0_g2~~TRINITY_DN410_c0_g2_i1.p1  ORF type:complete len:354 (+),score=18.05 TRINITY_DN410_c0_g2_i1:60-1064(+)
MASMNVFAVSCCLLLSFSCALRLHSNRTLIIPSKQNTSLHMSRESDYEWAWTNMNKTFNHSLFTHFRNALVHGAQNFAQARKARAFAYEFTRPHCDKFESGPTSMSRIRKDRAPTHLPADLSKLIMDVISANPVSKGNSALTLALGKQSLQMGMGLVQTVFAGIAHIVPPLVPPPVWTNTPLPCLPMVSGHNCFGAVLYPITFADFLVADMTDKVMDGYIATFPRTYAAKVGKTDGAMYKSCFSAYMSMHCSAIFPRCTTPTSRDEAIPMGGRVPLCLHLCILPLVMCPGFWIGDLLGTCKFVSVPPMCTQAFFWNLWRLPQQYETYDEAHPFQ